MSPLGAYRWLWSIPLLTLLVGAPARGQEAFDFETFGRHVREAQASYEEARALGDEDHEARRALLIDSSEAQQQAIDMLHEALEAGVFQDAGREEAMVRLLELNASVIVLMVETGGCSAAQNKLDLALAESHLLPDRGQDELSALRPLLEDCVPYLAEGEQPTVEPDDLAAAEDQPETGETGPDEAEVAQVEGGIGQVAGEPAEPSHGDLVIEERRPRSGALRTAAWVTGSLAVACLGTAAGFYLNTQSLQDELDAEVALPRFDPDRAQSTWSDIESSDDLMNVFLWSGVALAAGTAILVTLALVDDGDEVVLVPAATPGGAYAGVAWRF